MRPASDPIPFTVKQLSFCNPNTDARIGFLPSFFPGLKSEAVNMKMLSVLVSCALLLTASRLAAALKHAGALPPPRTSVSDSSHPAANLSESAPRPYLNIHRN
jgi:hypothetical protein